MNRSPFAVSQSSYDLSQYNIFTKRSFSSVVGRLYPRLNDKGEPVLDAIANLANETLDFQVGVLSFDQLVELCSRRVQQEKEDYKQMNLLDFD